MVEKRIGVLLVNLGTPDAPTPAAVRRYLAEFLSDPRVVDLPRWLWQPILKGIILNTRPKKSAHAYAQVWTDEGSPLAAITAAQAQALQVRLGETVPVEWAMRYGNPSIECGLRKLKDAGCERILFAPLYPQYCIASTASALDGLEAAQKLLGWQPELRVLPPYYNDRHYIAALREDIARQIAALPFSPEVLLLSFHGMPERTRERGDPYYDQCHETARLLTQALGPDGPRIKISFQSRFGRAKWLSPSTEDVLGAEAQSGTRHIAIATPGFSADCLETLEELAIRARETFLNGGGTHFATLACLNASDSGMSMLEALVRRGLVESCA